MTNVFILLVVYQYKHFLADFPLQTRYMLGKFKEGWDWVMPLTAHCTVHAILTFLIATIYCGYASPRWWLPLKLAAFDFVVHFIMDRIKAGPNLMGRWKALAASEFPTVVGMAGGVMPVPTAYEEREGKISWAKDRLKSNTYFWWALGLDQMVHHITHYIIIWELVS